MPCFLCDNWCKCCDYINGTLPLTPSVLPYNGRSSLPGVTRATKLHFIEHAFTPPTLSSTSRQASGAFERSKRKRQRVVVSDVPEHVVRLVRFRKLLDLLGTAHWASKRFEENEKILNDLIASHLQIIVGFEEARKYRTELCSLISSDDLSHLRHLLWITNRQQGKTWLLSRMYAALMMLSPLGGDLIDMYAPLFKRSQAVMYGARQYIVECQTNKAWWPELAALGMSLPRFKQENTETFTLYNCVYPAIENKFQSCPISVVSNRGNNAHCVGTDETAWCGRDHIYKMIMPLLLVEGRVATFITTPPEPENDFNDFIRQIKEGSSIFTLRNHSLLCDDCIEADKKRCVHKLAWVPSFKGVLKLEEMIRGMPLNEAESLEAELYGRIRAGKKSYFDREQVSHFIEMGDVTPAFVDPVVAISVDPPSHDVSCMGVTALTVVAGITVILGTCEVVCERSAVIDLEISIRLFTRAVLQHHTLRQCKNVRVISIVEANNNGILAKTITSCIEDETRKANATFLMPFIKAYFPRDIVPDVGILCTETNKLEGVVELYMAIVKRQVRFVSRFVTVGQHTMAPTCANAKNKLFQQLVEFKDDKKGKVSGKTANTHDDQAMSLIQGFHWLGQVLCIMAHNRKGGVSI